MLTSLLLYPAPLRPLTSRGPRVLQHINLCHISQWLEVLKLLQYPVTSLHLVWEKGGIGSEKAATVWNRIFGSSSGSSIRRRRKGRRERSAQRRWAPTEVRIPEPATHAPCCREEMTRPKLQRRFVRHNRRFLSSSQRQHRPGSARLQGLIAFYAPTDWR